MMDTMIRLEELTRSYDGRRDAVAALSLEIPRNCAFALLGRNGAGKTTLLKALSGWLRPDSGTVSVFGLDPYRDDVAVKRMLAYVSDATVCPLFLTPRRLLDTLRDFFPRYDERLAREIAGRFRLDLDRKIKELSLGQQRMVGLLAALARRPEVLVLDEPTLGLDVPARRTFMELVIERMGCDAMTVIFSSHMIAEIEGMVERAAIIDAGRLLLDGDVEELKHSIFLAESAADYRLPADWEVLRERPGRLLVRGSFDECPAGCECRHLSLEDIFVELM